MIALAVLETGEIYAASRDGRAVNLVDGVYGFLSLTALRFPCGDGIPLTHDGHVTIHRVLNGTHAILRGMLRDKVHRRDGRLLVLPLEYQPANDMHFCTSGEGIATAFNLLNVVSRRFVSGTGFAGGEVLWQDGFWERGHVAVNGVMYPVAEEFHEALDLNDLDEDRARKYNLRQDPHGISKSAAHRVQTFVNVVTKSPSQSPRKQSLIGGATK